MVDQEHEQSLLRNRLLGWGLVCSEIFPGVDLARDLNFTVGPNGRDLARVGGMDNLLQTLQIALTTRLEDDIFNTEFGFDGLNALAEETDPVMIRERVRIAIIQLLRKDPRIRRIIDVKLENGQLEEPTTGSRELNVRVAFETVSGDQTTIDLGRVIPNG